MNRHPLKTWREKNAISLARLADLMGLSGGNPASRLQRYEVGASRADADFIERIVDLTGGAIGPQEMHVSRLSHLVKHGKADPSLLERAVSRLADPKHGAAPASGHGEFAP